MEGNKCILRNPGGPEVNEFLFNRCIWSHDNSQHLQTNTDVFNDLGMELLNNAYEGFNSTIFAYGQTGSGKSYSIEGCPADQGLLQRIC